jgi:K+-sensing histidine kinase KdpD
VLPGEPTEMSISKRLVISLLIAAIVLFLMMLFWPFVLNNIIKPASLVLWLLLRILVLSIHQKYFWYAVIFVACILLFRLLPQPQSETQSKVHLGTNTTMINIGYWRGLFIYSGQNIQDEKTIKRELTHLLASLYATKQSTTNNFGIHDDMQQGRIPLPGNIHTFLFSQESPISGGPLKKFLHSIRNTSQKWIHRWTGQEKAEHYRMIDEVLNFLETSLEINHDDRKPTHNQH